MLHSQVHSAVCFITVRWWSTLSLGCFRSWWEVCFGCAIGKHPSPAAIKRSAFVSCYNLPLTSPQPILSKSLAGFKVLLALVGPLWCSDVDIYSGMAHIASTHLHDSVVLLACRLANYCWVGWHQGSDDELTYCTGQVPRVCPIGICKALHHIVAMVVALATRDDLEDVCGLGQLCSSLCSGIESAIHVVNELFNQHCDQGWDLLEDAKNALNSVNFVSALWNARVLWTCCSRFLFNTYAKLLLQFTGEYLLSRESVTQGILYLCCML